MTSICFLSLKGGTGKTTTSFNVAANLAAQGYKVLAVDLDPQGYLTCSFGESTSAGRKNVNDVFNGSTPVNEAIRVTDCGVHLLAGDLGLTTADLEMTEEDREFIMRDALEDVNYDVVIFDCCPFLGILSLNALVASDHLIIPTEPEFLAMRGVRQLYLKTVQLVQNRLNPDLEFSGVVVTRFDTRKNIHKRISGKMGDMFEDKVFETRIRTNVALAEATADSTPIREYDARSNGAVDYENLTKEIIERYEL
jgi:chromosome partitioning protein